MQHVTPERNLEDDSNGTGTSVELSLPVQDTGLFKHGATSHILNFFGDNPDIDVSIRQLSCVIPMSERATREAVDTLETNGFIRTFHEGNARRVHLNKDRFNDPSDPILDVPQTSFQTPVRVAHRYIEDELDGVKGIVLFGSVARGDADRRSDIDLWMLVAENHLKQRHEANRLAKRLEGLRIPPTIALADARNADFERNWDEYRERLEDDDRDWASAERYSFEFVVESPKSIIGQTNRIDAERSFGEGITLLSTETLERTKRVILNDE